ncbi:urease accessory protein UreD [Cohnella suwonensis]|uniref:Urease accessory protein UreD n=1 Tax=Cohnella suwonensis TaxID=696072 RepID=A0ABW0M2Z7_9BACL
MSPSSSPAAEGSLASSVPPAIRSVPVAGRLSELRATVGIPDADGVPKLVERYHTSPLKIAKTFSLRGEGDWRQLAVVQMDGSPGLLEGDRYSFDWELREGARLYATNQAYTRVHPCESETGDARLRQSFRLGAGAVLEWIPEPVMLFRDARFIAETEVELGEGAICMLGDLFSPGRLFRGEAFDFRKYELKVKVLHGGELIHYQRQVWEPETLPIRSAGCFGEFTHMGTFSVFSDLLGADFQERLRAYIDERPAMMEGVSWGVARTARHGVVVQLAGNAAWRLQRAILAAWDGARKLALGQPPLRLLKEAWMGGE